MRRFQLLSAALILTAATCTWPCSASASSSRVIQVRANGPGHAWVDLPHLDLATLNQLRLAMTADTAAVVVRNRAGSVVLIGMFVQPRSAVEPQLVVAPLEGLAAGRYQVEILGQGRSSLTLPTTRPTTVVTASPGVHSAYTVAHPTGLLPSIGVAPIVRMPIRPATYSGYAIGLFRDSLARGPEEQALCLTTTTALCETHSDPRSDYVVNPEPGTGASGMAIAELHPVRLTKGTVAQFETRTAALDNRDFCFTVTVSQAPSR